MIPRSLMVTGAALLLAMSGCGDLPVDSNDINPAKYASGVAHIDAEYVPDTAGSGADKVILTWTAPDHDLFDFYQIYRTTDTTEEGKVDTSSFEPVTEQGVSKEATTYTDIVGLVNGRYFYSIRMLTVETDTLASVGEVRDTVVGPWSRDFAVVRVGTSILFALNGGDVFTANDEVHITLEDPQNELDSVVFSQQTIKYLVKGQDSVRVSWDDPLNPPSTAEIRGMIGTWLDDDAQLRSGVDSVRVPAFSMNDPLNPTRRYAMQQDRITYSFPWTLQQGNGKKVVYAKLIYKDASHKNVVKEDAIGIAPWDIELNFRNTMQGPEKTMNFIPSGTGSDAGTYYLFAPHIEMSVSIFSDTTISPEFQYWYVTCTRNWGFTDIRSNPWIETEPKKASLTGIGPLHNSDHIYTYSIDPHEPGGMDNLDTIRVDTFENNIEPRAFKLRGEIDVKEVQRFNYTARPGSYWGPPGQVLYWHQDGQMLANAQKRIVDEAIDNYGRLTYMDPKLLSGLKQFRIVAVFKGRFFNDTRTVVSGTKGFTNSNAFLSAIDFYPPHIFMPWGGFEPKFEDILQTGVIKEPFDFILDQDESVGVSDAGKGNIIDLELVFAKLPQDYYFPGLGVERVEPDFPSPEYVKEHYQTTVFEYDIKKLDHELDRVVWEDIDPIEQNWSSGDYLVGVIAEDEYHNRGWAISQRNLNFGIGNPLVLRVETSR